MSDVDLLSEVVKAFQGHKGRPGQVGGSVPKQGAGASNIAAKGKSSRVTVNQLLSVVRVAGGRVDSREATAGASKIWVDKAKLSDIEAALKKAKISFKIRNDEFDGRVVQGKNFEAHRLGAEEGGGLIISVYKPGRPGYEYRMGLDI